MEWKNELPDFLNSFFVLLTHIYATIAARVYPTNPLQTFSTCRTILVEDIQNRYRDQLVLDDERSALLYVIFKI